MQRLRHSLQKRARDPWGVNRRRVVTINDGEPGERSISVACMHCSEAPCATVCPVDCFYTTNDGVVLHDKDICIGCGYCFYACPFGAPQFPRQALSAHAARWTNALSVQWPEQANSSEEYRKYGRNRLAEANCLCVLKCVQQKRFSPVMVTRSRISSVNASCIVVRGHFSGDGVLPMTSRV